MGMIRDPRYGPAPRMGERRSTSLEPGRAAVELGDELLALLPRLVELQHRIDDELTPEAALADDDCPPEIRRLRDLVALAQQPLAEALDCTGITEEQRDRLRAEYGY